MHNSVSGLPHYHNTVTVDHLQEHMLHHIRVVRKAVRWEVAGRDYHKCLTFWPNIT